MRIHWLGLAATIGLVLATAAPAGATNLSLPYSCETGVPSIGTLSAPIDVVTTTTPDPAGVFQKVAYTADLSLPDIEPQAFALNFDYFRVALDVPPGLRAVTVKVQNPGAEVANPPIADVSAQVVDGQVLVDLPAVPAFNRRFHFGTDGTFTYPFNTNTQRGGSEIVLPRIKITAMTTFGARGAAVDWKAPAVETFTNFFNIDEIPCTPDDPDATILSTAVTDTLAIPLNPYTDVSSGLDPAVSWARHLKVYKPAGTRFAPTAGVTRADAVVALWNLVDRPVVGTGNPFTDVPANAAYRDAVNWAVSEGVVTDSGNHKFKPTAPALRGPLVDMAFHTLHAQAGSPWPAFAYTDVPGGAPYAEALRWADAEGVVNEYSGGTKVKPTVGATRADLVKLLFRLANDDTWFRPLPTTVLVAPA